MFFSDDIHAKMPQKPNFESTKIRILGENGINSKLKHRKAHNSILSGRFGDLHRSPGDCYHIREIPGQSGRVSMYTLYKMNTSLKW